MHGTRSGWSTPGGSRVCACSEMARVRTSVVARASLLLHLARNRVYQDPCGDDARMCGKPSTPADRSQLSAAGAVQSDLERSRLARAARSESSSTCGLAVVLTPTRHRTITNARKTTQIDAPATSSPAPPHPFPAGIHRARGLSGSRAPAINCVPRARACQEAKVVYRTRGSRDLSHDGIWRKHAVPTDRCWPSSGAAVVQHIGRLLFPLLQPRILGPRRTIRAA